MTTLQPEKIFALNDSKDMFVLLLNHRKTKLGH